jgi:hypothetical protein
MRFIKIWLLLLSLSISQAVSQTQSPLVRDIIDSVTLDSLIYTVKVMSGEVGSKNGGTSDTIHSRFFDQPGHDLARDYLKGRLESYGLSTQLQPFTITFPGMNVLAEQPGTTNQDQKYILCAHYDSVSDSTWNAPGADDNASGVAAVLEAARLLSRYKTAYTVLYAFWDGEEMSTAGSSVYAKEARARGDSILGVINLDMIGFDSNNDSVMEVHARAYANSLSLADTVALVQNAYGIGLKPQIYYPGGDSQSDHRSFWLKGYSAVMLIEALRGNDDNPYWHTTRDRINQFNLPYFQQIARLAAGTGALLANVQGTASVPLPEPLVKTFSLDQNYPNPFNPSTTLRYGLPEAAHVTLIVYNTLGQKVAELVNGEVKAGYHEARWEAVALASGIYFARLTVTGGLGQILTNQTAKLVLMK